MDSTKRLLREIVNCYHANSDLEALIVRAEKYLGPQEGSEDHGTLPCYRRGCRCELCREANAIHSALYRSKKKYPLGYA